jgi:hypothetical protein
VAALADCRRQRRAALRQRHGSSLLGRRLCRGSGGRTRGVGGRRRALERRVRAPARARVQAQRCRKKPEAAQASGFATAACPKEGHPGPRGEPRTTVQALRPQAVGERRGGHSGGGAHAAGTDLGVGRGKSKRKPFATAISQPRAD